MSSVANAICCTPEPKYSLIQRDAQSAVGGLHHLAANDASGIGNVELRRLLDVKQRCVEQLPGQHIVVLHRLGDMVDRGETNRFVFARGLDRQELDIPDLAQWALLIDEI